MTYARPDHQGIMRGIENAPAIPLSGQKVMKREFDNFVAELVLSPQKMAVHVFAPKFHVPTIQQLIIELMQNRMYPPIIGYTRETQGHAAIYEDPPDSLIGWAWDKLEELDQLIRTRGKKP